MAAIFSQLKLAIDRMYIKTERRANLNVGSRLVGAFDFLPLFWHAFGSSQQMANVHGFFVQRRINLTQWYSIFSLQSLASSASWRPSSTCSRSADCCSPSCQPNTSALHASASEHGCVSISQIVSFIREHSKTQTKIVHSLGK